MELKLESKVALITGSNRGTGEVIANTLENEGALVVRHSNDKPGFQDIQQKHPDKPAIWGELENNQGAEQCISQLWKAVEHVDILVNNYGTASGGKWDDFNEERWLSIYQKNVLSAARLISALVPEMKTKKWGRIIQLSTIGSLSPNARMPHYYASKGALTNMSVSLAKELSGSGITVNTVSPGLILTEELKAAYQLRAQRKNWGESWPEIEKALVENDFPNLCGRIASREEVADLVCFLASEKAGFINAQNLRIDGGSLALTI
jgi:NAD(P)-dependent dehydrogenase (short-subunit alcohol dehydrogenase family)